MIDPYDAAEYVNAYQAGTLHAKALRNRVLESAELGDAVIAQAEAKVAAQRPEAWARTGEEVMRHLRRDVTQMFSEAVFAPADPVGHTAALISQALDALDDPSRPTPSNDQPLSEWDQIRASQQDWADIRTTPADGDLT